MEPVLGMTLNGKNLLIPKLNEYLRLSQSLPTQIDPKINITLLYHSISFNL